MSDLLEIFPNSSQDLREEVANQADNISEAADLMATLCEKKDSFSPEEELSIKLKGKQKKRVFVDEEYILDDCFSYYKSNTFDPEIPTRVVFSNQPGVDAGGLLRHFYSSIFAELTNEKLSNYRLFEGDPFLMVPISSSETCLSEIFVIVGKIIAHNICQGGQGFPYLKGFCHRKKTFDMLFPSKFCL